MNILPVNMNQAYSCKTQNKTIYFGVNPSTTAKNALDVIPTNEVKPACEVIASTLQQGLKKASAATKATISSALADLYFAIAWSHEKSDPKLAQTFFTRSANMRIQSIDWFAKFHARKKHTELPAEIAAQRLKIMGLLPALNCDGHLMTALERRLFAISNRSLPPDKTIKKLVVLSAEPLYYSPS